MLGSRFPCLQGQLGARSSRSEDFLSISHYRFLGARDPTSGFRGPSPSATGLPPVAMRLVTSVATCCAPFQDVGRTFATPWLSFGSGSFSFARARGKRGPCSLSFARARDKGIAALLLALLCSGSEPGFPGPRRRASLSTCSLACLQGVWRGERFPTPCAPALRQCPRTCSLSLSLFLACVLAQRVGPQYCAGLQNPAPESLRESPSVCFSAFPARERIQASFCLSALLACLHAERVEDLFALLCFAQG